MAREYAPIRLSIWSDDGFRALSPRAQHLHFVLLTSATLNHCGVADWRPKRIAALAGGWSASAVEAAGSDLSTAGYVVIDEDTEEVWVRSFIREDGLMKQPNMAVAMVSAWNAVASRAIRGAVVVEVRSLAVDQPELSCWGAKASKDLLAKMIDQGRPNPSPNPSGKGSVNPSGNPSAKGSGDPSSKGELEGFGDPSTNPSPTPAPTPTPTTCSYPTPTESAHTDVLIDIEDPPGTPETEGQRVNRLTKIYTDRVKPSKFAAVQGVVRQAVRADINGTPKYTDPQLTEALNRLADEGRSVTVDVLRYELDGIPSSRAPNGARRSTTDERVAQAQSLKERFAEIDAVEAARLSNGTALAIEGTRAQ